MPRTIQRYPAICSLMLVLMALAACGGQATQPVQRVTTVSTAASPSNAAASTAVPASTAASAAASAVAASPASAASPAAETSGRYGEIQQSTTAEGYYVLGDPAAPVVLMHYSDFL